MATFQPSPRSPTIIDASVTASSKNTSLNSEVPVSCWMGRISTPGWSSGTSRKLSPLWRLVPSSVRATTNAHWLRCASEVHTFWPSMCHLPSSPNRAVVATLARSEPAPGSE